jgi:hypothetical protein
VHARWEGARSRAIAIDDTLIPTSKLDGPGRFMVEYVEHRMFCLGGSLPAMPTKEDHDALLEALREAGLEGSLAASVIDGPVHPRSTRKQASSFTLEPTARSRLAIQIERHTTRMRLLEGVVRLIPPGYVDVITVYEVDDDVSLQEIEALGDIMTERADELLPRLERLIERLEAAGLVSPSPMGRLGVPPMLERAGLHESSGAYTYNQHVFYTRAEAFEAAATEMAEMKDGSRRFQYEGRPLVMSWALSLWHVDERPRAAELQSLLTAATLGLMESATIDNATACHAAFLQLTTRRTRPSAAAVRSVQVEHDLQLVRLALLRRNLEDRQQRYVQAYAEQGRLAEKHAVLRRAEESLRFAIEGIERESTEHGQRRTQIILAVLTSLTLYSVGNDVLGILSHPGLAVPTLISVPTLGLLAITAIVLVCVWIFRRYLRA